MFVDQSERIKKFGSADVVDPVWSIWVSMLLVCHCEWGLHDSSGSAAE